MNNWIKWVYIASYKEWISTSLPIDELLHYCMLYIQIVSKFLLKRFRMVIHVKGKVLHKKPVSQATYWVKNTRCLTPMMFVHNIISNKNVLLKFQRNNYAAMHGMWFHHEKWNKFTVILPAILYILCQLHSELLCVYSSLLLEHGWCTFLALLLILSHFTGRKISLANLSLAFLMPMPWTKIRFVIGIEAFCIFDWVNSMRSLLST